MFEILGPNPNGTRDLVNRFFKCIMACNYIFWYSFMIFLYSEWSSAVERAFLVIKRTWLFLVLQVLRPVQKNYRTGPPGLNRTRQDHRIS